MKIFSILQWPYWKFLQPWSNHVKQFEYLDWSTQRELAYKQIDKGGFGYWTVFVAGIGFLTDAYDIFAVNTVLPMLATVYWKGTIPTNQSVLIGLSLLSGTFFGQVVVGILADRYGRKKLYGIELVILTVATVLMAITSEGLLSSSNRLAWIVMWRFVMGIGIGGDYPLSAVITAEFAPRRHRGRMLASLFYMQPIGALLANLVAVIAVSASRNSLPPQTDFTSCTGDCIKAVDVTWRWIVGFGAVLPALGIVLRWWIPESPRYTLEVEKDPNRAKKDVYSYYQPGPSILHSKPSDPERQPSESVVAESSTRSPCTQATLSFGEPYEMKDISLGDPATLNPSMGPRPLVGKETWKEFWVGFRNFLAKDGNWTDLAGTSISWMTLDFAFYFLSVNNPKILSKLWNMNGNSPVIETFMQNSSRALIAVSIGAVLGGTLFIIMARYRWSLQFYGFFILAGMFVALGVCFVVLLNTRYFAAVIVLYVMCSLFFNFGPNTSTFVIAAEVFPTKYRCTCHGISAAAGKLGSIIAQIFLAYAKFGSPGVSVNDLHSTWLGWVFLVFIIWMAFGGFITKVWVPNPVNIWGQSRSLEDLALGKSARKRIEKEERESWFALVSG